MTTRLTSAECIKRSIKAVDGSPLALSLPYPPTVNHYWDRNRNGSLRIGEAGKAFRERVAWTVRAKGLRCLSGRLRTTIVAHPPDRRTRDLDNVLKALCDSLTHAGLWEDDGQIDDLRVLRGDVLPGGRVDVSVRELGQGWTWATAMSA